MQLENKVCTLVVFWRNAHHCLYLSIVSIWNVMFKCMEIPYIYVYIYIYIYIYMCVCVCVCVCAWVYICVCLCMYDCLW